MRAELPVVRGEGLCEIIKVRGLHSVERDTPVPKNYFPKEYFLEVYLMTAGGVKEHVMKNVEIKSAGWLGPFGPGFLYPLIGSRIFKGASLEALIEEVISKGTILNSNLSSIGSNYETFIDTYGVPIIQLANMWHRPEHSVVFLPDFTGGLRGIHIIGNMTPPIRLRADYARLSGDLSYEQVALSGEGIRRRGPESVELAPAEFTILEKPASVQSQASAVVLGKRAGTVMPLTYQGTLYVDPKILNLARQQQP